MRRALAVLLCLPLLGLSPAAAADTNAAADGAALAAACSSCHGNQGALERKRNIPRLDTQTAATLERKLLDYRSGTLQGTLMNRIARGFTEAELRAIAAALAQP